MRRRPPRTRPTATELARVEEILSSQPAFATHLGLKIPSRKRTHEPVSFHEGTIRVVQFMMSEKLDPERAHVRVVVRVAAEQFGIIRASGDLPRAG